MKYTTRYISLCAIACAVLAALHVQTHTVFAQDAPMRSDVTIYLDGPLLDRGGTVFVVPHEVPVEEWRQPSDHPNPALSDPELNARKPIAQRDKRLSARASQQISIVRFMYPAGGSYNFRFLPAPDSGIPPEQQGSVRVAVGNTYDYHPQTRAERFIPQFQVFTILGPESDESKSRALVSDVKLGYLEERYRCDQFDGVLSCGAERDTE